MAQAPVSEQSSSASTVPEEASTAAGAAVEPSAERESDAPGPTDTPEGAAPTAASAPEPEPDASDPTDAPEGAAPVPAAAVPEAPSSSVPATTPAPAAPPAPGGPSGPGEPPVEDDDEDDEDGGGGKMSFLDHLDELRTRLITSFVAIAGGFLACFAFIAPIFDFIMEPLAAVLEEGVRMIYTNAPEYFFLQLKMAALVGLIVATPVVMSQVWLFIAPGLYAHEKKFAIPFVGFASFFFIGGTLFGHYILFQVAWAFFAGFGAENEYVEFTPRLQDAFSLYVRLVLACGVIFQLPTLVFFLARMGVASPQFLIRNFKYAFLLCFVFAAILTPTPDPVTMTVMAGPMIALYGLSIGIAWVFRQRGSE